MISIEFSKKIHNKILLESNANHFPFGLLYGMMFELISHVYTHRNKSLHTYTEEIFKTFKINS